MKELKLEVEPEQYEEYLYDVTIKVRNFDVTEEEIYQIKRRKIELIELKELIESLEKINYQVEKKESKKIFM